MPTIEAQVRERIVNLTWDDQKKGAALAQLPKDRVRILHGLPAGLFETTLEAHILQGMECLRSSRLVCVAFVRE